MLGDWILTRLSGAFVDGPVARLELGHVRARRSATGQSTCSSSAASTRSVFPPVVECGSVIGAVTAGAAAATGLREGTPVVAGGADTQLGLLGIGVTQPGRVTIVGGSFWQATVVLDEPLIDPRARLRTLCHTVPGRWMMEGIGFYCGIVMRWFRDAFCELETLESRADGRGRLRDHGAESAGSGRREPTASSASSPT